MRREPPPSRDYLKDKSAKKTKAKTAGWMLAIGVVIFGLLIAKFAMSDGRSAFSGLPDSDTAYDISKEFITPTIRATSFKFDDDQYKFAKQSDSVYVIKSSYTTNYDDGENQTTHFTITLQYKGGMGSKIGNWAMLNLDQDN